MDYKPTYLGEIELSEETLAHYGIKGMKWRRRKGMILGYRGNGQMDWANKKRKPIGNRPMSRRRNITGSGSGAYRKGNGTRYRVGVR